MKKKAKKFQIPFHLNNMEEDLKQKLLDFRMETLWIPSEIKVVENIPLLGSGKIDFSGAKRLAL